MALQRTPKSGAVELEGWPDIPEVEMLLFAKNLLFTVLVPGTVAVYLPLRMAGGWAMLMNSSGSWRQGVAVALLLLGTAIYLVCVWGFATVGRGTPAPIDAPKRLVAVGLYRYVRNPMYVGVLSVVTGWSVYFWSWRLLVYAGGLALGFHIFVVLYEEPRFARQFGESYERYCRAVHRWLPRRPHEEAA